MSEKKAVLVTGAVNIGACIAETLAKDGYNIIISDIIPEEKAFDTVEKCKSHGVEVLYIKGDVSSYSDCEAVVKAGIEKFGGIYALINNAGIRHDGLLMRMSEDQFDRVIAVNLKGVYNMSKLAVSHMIKAKEGRIVNISSIVGISGNAGQTNYSASKAGIIGFTKSLAKEVGSRGITVNAIAPGYIATDMTDSLSDSNKQEYMARIALKTFGQSQDVANAVSFLVSDKASYITAHVLSVDGGMSG